ncbi:mCG144970, partial [Mus musculus]
QPGSQTSQLSGLHLERKVIGTDGFSSLFQRIVCIFYQFKNSTSSLEGMQCHFILQLWYYQTGKEKHLKNWPRANLANNEEDRIGGLQNCLLVISPVPGDSLVLLSLCLQ